MKKQAIVVHSGGMDSSLCLAMAKAEFGAENILSMSFDYEQRHSNELACAAKICRDWHIDHIVLPIQCLQQITSNALMDSTLDIVHNPNEAPNTLVIGRNGLMLRLAAIHASSLGANYVYTGVIEVESANSGYRDCNRAYIDLMEKILRIDLGNFSFEIRTPVIFMTKAQTMELGLELGVLEYLLENTITCYKGIAHLGCQTCPACLLRNEGIQNFLAKHPSFKMPKMY